MLWGPKSLISVLWLTKILIFPFWEMHPSSLLSLFLSTMYLLLLSKIIELVAVDAIHLCPWKKSENSQLTVVVGFGCVIDVAVHVLFCHGGDPVFSFHARFWDSLWGEKAFIFCGATKAWSRIFYIWLFKYFRACFWYRMTCNSVKTSEPKNWKPRPSGDEISDWNCFLKLSVKLKTELKNGVARSGSLFNAMWRGTK